MIRTTIVAIAAAGVLATPAFAETAAQMQANKTLVLEFYRNVFEPQRLAAMKDYYAADVIEHNPNIPSGIDGFARTMGARWAPKPVQAKLANPPDFVMADGDLVTLIFKRQRPDPADPAKTYDAFWWDMFRVKDGKIVEHWDGATKPAAAPRP